jgi:hypothetical protein
LDKKDSNVRAASDKLPESFLYQTPVKQSQELVNAVKDMNLGDKAPSPEPPPAPSRERGIGRLQEVDDAESDSMEEKLDDETRTFCGSAVMKWHDRLLPVVLASVIKKMMLARQNAEPTVLRLANETTFAWKKVPPQSSLNFDLCISSAVKMFFHWEDLGHGADGRAFLVSGGTKGAVGVLKLFYTDPQNKSQHEEIMWKEVYSHLFPVANSVRTVEVMGQTALLMPWFQCPKRTQSSLDAVEKTLREDFMEKGIRHDDVAWRNVGVYSDNGQTKAVMFDMQKVHFKKKQEDWVESAVAALSQKLIQE